MGARPGFPAQRLAAFVFQLASRPSRVRMWLTIASLCVRRHSHRHAGRRIEVSKRTRRIGFLSDHAIHTQFGKFLLVGVGNAVLTFTLYELLLVFTGYMTAFAISAICGLIFTTLLTIVVTFDSGLTSGRIAAQGTWYAAYAFIFAVCLKLTVDRLGIPPGVAPFPLLAILTPLNFFCARWLIKRSW